MKLAPIVAMLVVAADCFAMGFGTEPQTVFSDKLIWLWHLLGLGWVFSAIIFYHE